MCDLRFPHDSHTFYTLKDIPFPFVRSEGIENLQNKKKNTKSSTSTFDAK